LLLLGRHAEAKDVFDEGSDQCVWNPLSFGCFSGLKVDPANNRCKEGLARVELAMARDLGQDMPPPDVVQPPSPQDVVQPPSGEPQEVIINDSPSPALTFLLLQHKVGDRVLAQYRLATVVEIAVDGVTVQWNDDELQSLVPAHAIMTEAKAAAGAIDYRNFLSNARNSHLGRATKVNELNPTKRAKLTANVASFFYKENVARMEKGWPSESLLTDQFGFTPKPTREIPNPPGPFHPMCECCPNVVWKNPKLENITKHFKSANHLKNQRAIVGNAAVTDPISVPGPRRERERKRREKGRERERRNRFVLFFSAGDRDERFLHVVISLATPRFRPARR
jgi:hypothetical protein